MFDYALDGSREGVFDLARVGAAGIDTSALDGSKALLRTVYETTARDRGPEVEYVMQFARSLLYYRSMWRKDEHIGLVGETEMVGDYIVRNGLFREVEDFLREVGGEDVHLGEEDGRLVIVAKNRNLPFMSAASRGTVIMCQLFCWVRRAKGLASLMLFDDFDSLYHYRMSEAVMRRIISGTDAQCIFVTHNTGLVSNELVRPDCVFILRDGRLSSLSSLTDKDLRRGHNLEKMLREGAFDGTPGDGKR